MRKIYINPLTNNYDINISIREWIEILSLPEVQKNEKMLWALEKWFWTYPAPVSCKMLVHQFGKTHNFYSVQNRILGKIAVDHLDRFQLVHADRKHTYWGVAWITYGKRGTEELLCLRSELAEAIQEICFFGAQTLTDMRACIQTQDLRAASQFDYLHERLEPPMLMTRSTTQFVRNPNAAKNALLHARHTCEYDASHASFPRAADGLPYMETHHLIPMQYANVFDVSIDIPENIVCLCSTCHRRIHHGQDRNKLVKQLWRFRSEDLQKAGIQIELTRLLELYRHLGSNISLNIPEQEL